MKELPILDGGSVGDDARKLDRGAGEVGFEVIQFPLVIWQKAQVRLDFFD